MGWQSALLTQHDSFGHGVFALLPERFFFSFCRLLHLYCRIVYSATQFNLDSRCYHAISELYIASLLLKPLPIICYYTV